MGVALWLMRKHAGTADESMYRKATSFGAIFALVASLGVIVSGDIQGKIMTEVQPMKMAAAEGLYDTTSSAPFSVLSIGSLDGSEATRIIEIPGLLSFMATGSFDGTVEGINDLQVSERRWPSRWPPSYGPQVAALVTADSYAPLIPLTYWSFRFMIGLGALTMFFAALTLWGTRKGAVPVSTVVGVGRRADAARPRVREQLGLDLHRGRPSAVDRLRPDDHLDRRLAVGQHR